MGNKNSIQPEMANILQKPYPKVLNWESLPKYLKKKRLEK